jgi:hypothetical protein
LVKVVVYNRNPHRGSSFRLIQLETERLYSILPFMAET